MSEHHSDEAAYFDASSCFSEEEWALLQEWQKKLCQNMMKEIDQALMSLGSVITTMVFSLRAKEKQKMFPMDSQESGRSLSVNDCPSSPSTENHKETLHLDCLQVSQTVERNNCFRAGHPVFKSSIPLRKEEEPLPLFIDQLDADCRDCNNDHSSGHEVISLRIKEEEDTYYQENMIFENIINTKDDRHLSKQKNFEDSMVRIKSSEHCWKHRMDEVATLERGAKGREDEEAILRRKLDEKIERRRHETKEKGKRVGGRMIKGRIEYKKDERSNRKTETGKEGST
ncbi:hypothetical protein NDU88_006051 [Pleurodeles waltl]|uniref:KRAB domain-containing protein n=1 Tax=Pleurodeles waltl TaxID=8319 RepID=A0AAV7QKV2_PLEWA|nr:hypothetical protein NDU88_006051 [Pleurodeles waltl]